MIHRLLYFTLLISIILVFGTPSLGCTQGETLRVSVPAGSYVLVARVVGYLEPLPMDRCTGAYPGLLVVPEVMFRGPSPTGQRIELYPYQLSNSCQSSPMSTEELKSRFPLASRVRVVASVENPCDGTALPTVEGTTRLFASAQRGDVATVGASDPDPASSQPFDYSGLSFSRQHKRGDAVEFELWKDFVRLESVATSAERAAIVGRLKLYFDVEGCKAIVKANVTNAVEAQSLVDMCRTVSLDKGAH